MKPRTIFYPTQEQEKAIREWLFNEIQEVLNNGTDRKEFDFETDKIDSPMSEIFTSAIISAEHINEYAGEDVAPSVSCKAEICMNNILGIDEEENEYLIFIDVRQFEDLKKYDL